jgi:hypothetical protein
MTIKTFIRLPYVRLGIHVILLSGIAFNIIQFFRISTLHKSVEKEKLVLQLLEDRNTEANNKKDFYSSKLYEEVFAKEKLYQIRDERMLDTSGVEGDNETVQAEYIPNEVVQIPEKNYLKWFNYFTQYNQ